MANEFVARNGIISRNNVIVTGSLNIFKSGSTIFNVEGSTGQLFTITDSLTGSLFSVNTVAGLPVIEAFSDNTVNIGKFGTYPIKVVATGTLASITGSMTGSFTGSVLGSATSASYAATASFVNPLTQSVLISGSLLATSNIGVQDSQIGVRIYGSNNNAIPGYFQFLYNGGASTGGYLNYTYNGQFTFADTNTALGAKLGVKGQGTTSATTAFLVQNSAGSTNAQIYDDGQWFIGTGNIRVTGEPGNFKFDTAAGNVANIGHWGINFQPLGYSTKVSISNTISITGSVYASGSQTINGNLTVTGSITSSQDIQVNNINIGRGGTSGSNSTGYNIAIGEANFSSSASTLNRRNIAIGPNTLEFLSTGYENVAIGSSALRFNQTPSYNVAIGSNSMLSNTGGEYNTAIGYRSLSFNTYGGFNVAVGWDALYNNLVGDSNVGVGNAALQGNRHGRRNVAVGDGALGILSAATSSNNTGLGYSAGVSLRSGSYNTFIGSDNDPIISGSSNTFLGSRINLNAFGTGLLNNTVALADGSGSIRLFSPSSSNVIIGGITDLGYKFQVSGSGNFGGNLIVTGSITSSENIQIRTANFGVSGPPASSSLNIGWNNFLSQSQEYFYGNIAIGDTNLQSCDWGYDNIAIGRNNTYRMTSGSKNIAIGSGILQYSKEGSNNIGLGNNALQYDKSGSYNVALGTNALGFMGGIGALFSSSFNDYNIGLGFNAGWGFYSGSYNLFLGSRNDTILSGSFNTFVGSNIRFHTFGNPTITLEKTVILADGSGSIRLFSPSSSNVIIGGTTDLGYKFQVSGSGNFTGNLTTTGSLTAGVSSIGRYGISDIADTSSANIGLTVRGETVFGGTTYFGTINSTKYLQIWHGAGGPYIQSTTVLPLILSSAYGGALYITNDYYSYFTNGLAVATGSTGGYTFTVGGTGNFKGNLTITGSATNSLRIKGSGTTTSTNTLLVENSSGNTGLVVNDARQVGVGTSSPMFNFDVYGDYTKAQIRSSGENQDVTLFLNTPFNGTSAPKTAIIAKALTNWSRNDLYFCLNENTVSNAVSASTADAKMVILNGGNVGIGTTSPGDKLQIQNGNLALYTNSYGNNGLIRMFGTDNAEKYQQGLTTDGDFYQYTFTGRNHIFYTNNGSERMRITSAGNVGIGTTTPSTKLDVNGNTTITGSATNSLRVKGSGTTTSTNTLLIENSSGTNLLNITDGQVSTFGRKSAFTYGPAAVYIGNGPYNFETSLVLDAYSGNDLYYKTIIYSGYSYANPFRITANNYDVLYSYEGGAGLQVPTILSQNVKIWQSLEFYGYYHHIHGDFATQPVGNKFTNVNTNTGSLDGLFMGLWTGSNGNGRVWNYETTGIWDFGVGNQSKMVLTTSSLAITNSVSISGSASTSSAALTIYKSGSTTLDIQGSSGQLFSVIDSLTGSLMSVNDVSGLPILEVFSDDKVVMGTYGTSAMVISGSSTVTSGSLRGRVVTVPTASGTASMDCSQGNFFSLTLSGSSTLFLSASNIQPGQTINLRIIQPATSGSLNYGSMFKFAPGLPYTASATSSVTDIVSFISFDTTALYGSAMKGFV